MPRMAAIANRRRSPPRCHLIKQSPRGQRTPPTGRRVSAGAELELHPRREDLRLGLAGDGDAAPSAPEGVLQPTRTRQRLRIEFHLPSNRHHPKRAAQSSVSSCSNRLLRRRSGPVFPSDAGCSTIAMTHVAMKRPTRTGCPVRVSSATSTMPRSVVTSTRLPARVAVISNVRALPVPASTITSTVSPITRPL